MTDDSDFNISEIKLSITSLYIISEASKYDIIWTENSNVIDSFISVILKNELSVIQSLSEKPQAVLFTPLEVLLFFADHPQFRHLKDGVELTKNQLKIKHMYVGSKLHLRGKKIRSFRKKILLPIYRRMQIPSDKTQ